MTTGISRLGFCAAPRVNRYSRACRPLKTRVTGRMAGLLISAPAAENAREPMPFRVAPPQARAALLSASSPCMSSSAMPLVSRTQVQTNAKDSSAHRA